MTSCPKEHDYIGLSGTLSMEGVPDKLSSSASSSSTLSIEENKDNASLKTKTCLNMKDTELRLGLPGSLSPERKPQPVGVSLFGKDIDMNASNSTNGYSFTPLKGYISGAKRGFSDAIDVSSAKWVFSVGNGSDADVGKAAVLFTHKGDDGNTQKSSGPGGVGKKEAVSVVTRSSERVQEKNNQVSSGANENSTSPAAKAQVVGWPPIRSFRKNTMASNLTKNGEDADGNAGYGCLYVKVCMDGAPYLRKVDLKTYSNYIELSSALEKMFSGFTIGQCGSHGLGGRDGLNESSLRDLLRGSEYVLTYEDKDGDWMLVGDVPWEMFTDSCRRLRIMKGSEAIGLAPRTVEKSKIPN